MAPPINWRLICDNVLSPYLRNRVHVNYREILDSLTYAIEQAAEQRIPAPDPRVGCCCGHDLLTHGTDGILGGTCNYGDCSCLGYVNVGSPKAMLSMHMENVFSRIRTLEIHLAPGADINLVQPMRVPPDLPVKVEVAEPSREDRYYGALKAIESKLIANGLMDPIGSGEALRDIADIVIGALRLSLHNNDTKETPTKS